MAIDFNEIKKRAQSELGKRSDKIEQGLDKASGFAKSRMQGRDQQIDNMVGKAKTFVHQQSGDQGPDGGPSDSGGGPTSR